MHTLTTAITFAVMAQPKETTVQLGVRVRKSVKQLLIDFSADHPLQPPLANIVERAIVEYVQRERPNLPKPEKRKP